MYKKFVLICIIMMMICCATTAFAAPKQKQNQANISSLLDLTEEYYPEASLAGAIEKYKKSDYSGCIQELLSYVIKEPADAVAFYYIAMSYANIGDNSAAVEAYQKVIDLTKDPKLSEYAVKGKDCLTNGPTCLNTETNQKNKGGKGSNESPEQSAANETVLLEKFINEPYGSGLSQEMEKQMKEETLKQIQESINKKDSLENSDVQRIKNFDNENSSSETDTQDKIANAEPSDKEILKAIKTLRDAGMNVSVQASKDNSSDTYSAYPIHPHEISAENTQKIMQTKASYDCPVTMINGYTDPEMAQISLMLGNNNSNNNNGIMNMLPFLIQQNQNGQNIDPQLMQAVMLQQMMPSMDLGLNNNNN